MVWLGRGGGRIRGVAKYRVWAGGRRSRFIPMNVRRARARAYAAEALQRRWRARRFGRLVYRRGARTMANRRYRLVRSYYPRLRRF